jgi:hypothetical protein
VTRCEMVVCWAATEARLVKVRYTETGERASGMPQILYRGPERGEKGRDDGIGGSGRMHRRRFSGKSDTSESPLEDESSEKGGGGREGEPLCR